MKKDYQWLCDMMKSRKEVEVASVRGIINQIQAEDGSGKCWNVLINKTWVFVRSA